MRADTKSASGHPIEVVSVAGYAGDRFAEGMSAVRPLAKEIASHFDVEHRSVGTPRMEKPRDAAHALALSAACFRSAREQIADSLARRAMPILVTARCAPSMATIPEVLKTYPGAVVVWFDAHGDLNTPDGSRSGYLGGMCLAAILGKWSSGFGSGLNPRNLMMIGVRDLDDFERKLIAEEGIAVFPRVAETAVRAQIAEFARGRPVFVHLDTDCFRPDEVAAEFRVAGGLKVDDVADVLGLLSEHGDVVGIEIAEFYPRNADDSRRGAANIIRCLQRLLPDDQALKSARP